MSKKSSAVFIAVGTELTSGELINSNSAWVAQRLEDFGLEVRLHLTVPDDRPLIKEALDTAAGHADFVFVSGGLGPTKDDFTREVIAEWAQKPLERHEPSVIELRNKFAAIGRTFHSFQEQQCEFPQGARIIKNQAGTADAFYVKKDQTHLWTLPGPPREIASVWPEISEQLKELVVERKSLELRSWLCFGEGESAIAKITEDVIENKPFQTGYRAHAPYVEVKIWGRPEDFQKHHQLEELTQALKPYLMSRERKTYSKSFAERIKDGCEIIDGVSRGELVDDILKVLREAEKSPQEFRLSAVFPKDGFSQSMIEEFLRENRSSSSVYFVLPSSEEREYWVGRKNSEGIALQRVNLPPELKISRRFQSLWAAEKACALWLRL